MLYLEIIPSVKALWAQVPGEALITLHQGMRLGPFLLFLFVLLVAVGSIVLGVRSILRGMRRDGHSS